MRQRIRRHVTRLWLGIAILAIAALPCTGQAVPQTDARPLRNLTIDDFFALKRVQDPQISPDAKWVAYTITTLNLKDDKSERRIWMSPYAGGDALPMTAKETAAWSPRWSPDGKYLAILSDRRPATTSGTGEAKTQVWLLDRRGGEAQQLTEVRQGVQSFEWSPDGARLVLAIRDPTPEEAAEKEDARPKPKTPRPWLIDRLQFKQDGAGYLDRRRTHLYVFDLATKKLTQITSGDFDHSQPAWSPDGKRIAFVSNRTAEPDSNFNTDVWLVAADTPDQGKTLIQVTTNPGPDRAPEWSPDGEWIAHVSVTDAKAIVYATPHLAVAPARGGPARVLTEKLDRHVANPRFAPDGRSIYFVLEDSGEQHLARIPAGGGEITRPISGKRSVGGFEIARDGAIVALISEPHIPGELFTLDGSTLKQITKTNDALLAQIRLTTPEKIRYPSADGTLIEGFLYKPIDFNPGFRYPGILSLHGGPVSQVDWGFNFLAQLYAANGYIVVLPNFRGSSGYGQAFSLAIWQDWGNKDSQDAVAAMDYAVAQGLVDAERTGVGGWSYGGILTNYTITKTQRFKGAISGASEVLMVANYGHDHYQRWWEYEFGPPWVNRELWERLSPFNSITNITTPTLVLCGEKDWNVPVQNSEQLYQSLKRLGRTTELVVYPGESHSLRTPSYQKDRFERYLAWFAKYVKGEPAAAPAEKTVTEKTN